MLKVGNVIRLKSGGPDMTVGGIREDGAAYCHYFQYQGTDPETGESVWGDLTTVTVFKEDAFTLVRE